MEELLLQDDRTSTAVLTLDIRDLSQGASEMISERQAYCFFMHNSVRLNDFYTGFVVPYNNKIWNHGRNVYVLSPNFRVDTEMYRDFLTYKEYDDNWDGEGGFAMTKDVARNFEQVYHLLSMEAIDNMVLSLDYNGTLLLETVDGNAGIEIGNEAYTYHIFVDDEIKGEEHLPFSATAVALMANNLAEKAK